MVAFARRAFVRTLFRAAIVAVTLSCADFAHAQEIILTGPLVGAPAGPRRVVLRENRIELAVSPGASFGSFAYWLDTNPGE